MYTFTADENEKKRQAINNSSDRKQETAQQAVVDSEASASSLLRLPPEIWTHHIFPNLYSLASFSALLTSCKYFWHLIDNPPLPLTLHFIQLASYQYISSDDGSQRTVFEKHSNYLLGKYRHQFFNFSIKSNVPETASREQFFSDVCSDSWIALGFYQQERQAFIKIDVYSNDAHALLRHYLIPEATIRRHLDHSITHPAFIAWLCDMTNDEPADSYQENHKEFVKLGYLIVRLMLMYCNEEIYSSFFIQQWKEDLPDLLYQFATLEQLEVFTKKSQMEESSIVFHYDIAKFRSSMEGCIALFGQAISYNNCPLISTLYNEFSGELIIKKSIENEAEEEDINLLYLAAQQCHAGIFEILLSGVSAADIQQVRKNDKSLFYLAAGNSAAVLNRLFDKFKDSVDTILQTIEEAIIQTFEKKEIEKCKLLLEVLLNRTPEHFISLNITNISSQVMGEDSSPPRKTIELGGY